MPTRSSSTLFALAISLAGAAGLGGGCVGGSGETETTGETHSSVSATETASASATTGESSTEATSDASATSSGGTDATTKATTSDTTTGATTSATTSDTTSATTTGGAECDLEEIACARAELGGELFIECGVVDPWESTPKEWQAARQCALDAIAEEKAFKLVTWLQGIDSEVGYAYVGFVGESYEVIRFFFDSYPPAVVNENTCASLTAEASCIAAVDQICLTCVEPGPSATICGG